MESHILEENNESGFTGMYFLEEGNFSTISTEEGNFRITGKDTTRTEQTSRVTYSQSIQDTANAQQCLGLDARQQRALNVLVPYLQAASDSDEDHGYEDQDIAGRGVNTG